MPSSLRDLLLGEAVNEPIPAFDEARALVEQNETARARDAFRAVAESADEESLTRLYAWRALAALGQPASTDVPQELLGVVFEVGVPGGLDLLAVYADRTARYYNYSGAGVVWLRPDASLDRMLDAVLDVARAILPQLGPWTGPRPAAPDNGYLRLNFLAPAGRYFGEGPFDALDQDPTAHPLIAAGTALMQKLTTLPNSTRAS